MGITDAERVLKIVGDLDRLLVGMVDPVLRDVGLTREHWQVLRLLAEDGHGHPMGEISAGVRMAGATATRTVDVLAQRMLVYRRNDPLDRRRVLIYLAEPGRQILDRVNVGMLDRVGRLLHDFEAEERVKLLQLLERLTTARPPTPA